jgi:hypothetical protein
MLTLWKQLQPRCYQDQSTQKSYKIKEQYKQIAYLNHKLITKESQKQAPVKKLDPDEHSSGEALIGQNSSRTLLFYSIFVSLIETNPKMN